MTVKFGRNYLLQIGTQSGGTLTIQPPFSIEFDITRNMLSSANVCSFRIFNLSTNNRNQVRKDVTDYGSFRRVTLKAGYGSNLPIIFDGNVTQAWSVREGVNFITQVESFDGGFALLNGNFDQQFSKGTPVRDIMKSAITAMPNVAVGVIGDYAGTIGRGNSYSGPAGAILNEYSGGGFFIDNGKANVLGESECLKGEIDLLDSAAGLLGTPIREQTIVHFDIIFEPRLVIGQFLQLKSELDSNFNGYYKVISVKHRGMISEAVAGEATTSVGLFAGTQQLRVVGAQ